MKKPGETHYCVSALRFLNKIHSKIAKSHVLRKKHIINEKNSEDDMNYNVFSVLVFFPLGYSYKKSNSLNEAIKIDCWAAFRRINLGCKLLRISRPQGVFHRGDTEVTVKNRNLTLQVNLIYMFTHRVCI